jgi:hypothetical protein
MHRPPAFGLALVGRSSAGIFAQQFLTDNWIPGERTMYEQTLADYVALPNRSW